MRLSGIFQMLAVLSAALFLGCAPSDSAATTGLGTDEGATTTGGDSAATTGTTGTESGGTQGQGECIECPNIAENGVGIEGNSCQTTPDCVCGLSCTDSVCMPYVGDFAGCECQTCPSTGGGSSTEGTTDEGITDDVYPGNCVVTPTLSSLQENYFNQSCTFSSCHGNGGKAGGLVLDDGVSHTSIVGVTATHPGAAAKGKMLVVAGEAASSFFYHKLAGPAADEGLLMPQGQQDPLGIDCQLRAVRDWINDGALDN